MMRYKGRKLTDLNNGQLVRLCLRLAAQLRMIGSTEPEDLNVDDIADLLPPDDIDMPKVSAILYKGKGKAGGR